ncbi:MAG: class I SAM-dependent methyltransferase [Verrucomicrobiae bacterium]|nr:class I SAM-dependent methyltransferase [Verrucomicrobiae bacterium]
MALALRPTERGNPSLTVRRNILQRPLLTRKERTRLPHKKAPPNSSFLRCLAVALLSSAAVSCTNCTVASSRKTQSELWQQTNQADFNAQTTEFDLSLGGSSKFDPFAPTPQEVVSQMLRFAGVSTNDVVYDLGSGDGRIPIAAAKEFGAHAVGIEILPDLVKKSREAAAAAGVADRVRFIQQDMFTADISPATVVTLYLYPRTALRLRPILLRQLRPGTRIVAYDYGIEQWPRDKEQPVEPPNEGTIYLWVVPANVTGKWKVSAKSSWFTRRTLTLHLHQKFQSIHGTATLGRQTLPLTKTRLCGREISFTVERPITRSRLQTLRFTGHADGHRMYGKVELLTPGSDAIPRATTLQWHAIRNPATLTAIDPPLPQRKNPH